MKVEIGARALPAGALLERYRDTPGAYTDCFSTTVARPACAADYIEAFYTTWLFRCERLVLRMIGRGGNDAEAHALATGEASRFAAWTVEDRSPDQLLVCDFAGLTRSWLMVEEQEAASATRLYFGSAVVPRARDKSGNPRPGWAFRVFQPAHAFYARALLRAAARKLGRLRVDRPNAGPRPEAEPAPDRDPAAG